jgi:hypothetical protein
MDEKQQLRLFYSLRDFQLALSAWTFFLEVDPNEPCSKVELRRFRCYQDMAAVAYWRPFSRSNGLPVLTLEGIGVTPTAEQLALHERLRVYRNKVVAHSDPELMRILLTCLSVEEDGGGPYLPMVRWDEGLDLLDDQRPLELWLRTLIHAISRITFGFVQSAPQPFHFLKDHLLVEQDEGERE